MAALVAPADVQIAGYLLGDSLRWTHVAIWSGVLTLTGSALVFVSRVLQARRKGTWKV